MRLPGLVLLVLVAGCSSSVPVTDGGAVDAARDASGAPEDAGVAADAQPWTPEFPGHPSFKTLTTSNGLVVATFARQNAEAGSPAINQLDRLKPHIYVRYEPSSDREPNLLSALDLGLRGAGRPADRSWLRAWDAELAELVPGTNIIHVSQTRDGARVETFFMAPFHHPAAPESPDPVFVVLARVTALDRPIEAPTFLALADVLVRGSRDRLETVERGDGWWAESAGTQRVLYWPLAAGPVRLGAAPSLSMDSPRRKLEAGQPMTELTATATRGPEILVGLELGLQSAGETLAPGESGWAGLVIATTPRGVPGQVTTATLAAHARAFVGGRSAPQILAAERAWWDDWHKVELIPEGVHPYERQVYRQSTAVLKMGQLREPHGGRGQILASLVPGQWNISWVRDAAYAIRGLVAARHFPEARAGLEFMLNARMQRDGDANRYQKNYIERDLGVRLSADYAISVTRYFGNGEEESDTNNAGPNIEFDNWGLFLWALGDYVEATGDDAFLRAHWPKVSTRVANLLIELIEPATGVLHTDSSIWERHWSPYGRGPEPETRKHFAYSNLCAIAGLRKAAGLATRMGDAALATRYQAAADGLAQAVLQRFVITPAELGKPVLAGNLEELGDAVRYMDQAVVEAMNLDLFEGRPDLAEGTIAAFDRWLAIGPRTPGFKRNDDGTEYDKQEWVMIDLRTAEAFFHTGQPARGWRILDWVTDQARQNDGLIPELLDAVTGDYQSNTPMTGFGPGAYLLALTKAYQVGRAAR